MIDTADERALLVMYIRYEDSFVKREGTWRLRIDWTDRRPSQP